MKPYVGPLATAPGDLQQATAWLKRHAAAAPDNAAAGAIGYLHLMGLVVLGYMWCRIAEAALALDAAAGRVRGKLVTGRLFVERMLPETLLHLARILGAANLTEWPAKAF
jgi:acyl-CoA dehydrogenase